jgi:hypothetical protein
MVARMFPPVGINCGLGPENLRAEPEIPARQISLNIERN